MIKFITDDTSRSQGVNSVDRGILELKTAVQNLHVQVDGLQNKIDELSTRLCSSRTRKVMVLAQMHKEGDDCASPKTQTGSVEPYSV